MRLAAFCADDYKANTADERDTAQDGRDRHSLVLLVGNVHRAKVRVAVAVGVMESAKGESCNTHHDE